MNILISEGNLNLARIQVRIPAINCILTVGTTVGTLIVATIYLQLIQNRYMFRSFTTCFEVLLSFNVVTSIVYNPLPAMWKS